MGFYQVVTSAMDGTENIMAVPCTIVLQKNADVRGNLSTHFEVIQAWCHRLDILK